MVTTTTTRTVGRLIGVLLLAGCGGGSEETTAPQPAPTRVQETVISETGVAGPPLPKFVTGQCRVYTSEPGWSVFVDGYPVRNAQGETLRTPCLVAAVATSHSVSVAHAGRIDQSRQILFAEDAEVMFETANVAAGDSLLLAAPFLGMGVGRPINLNTLNTGGNEFDPFLSADGRGLVFAADRPEGRGIYTATRLSPLHPFDPPTLLRLTSSVDQAASPSVNGEATMIVYSLPAKGRIRALTRPSPLEEFADPEILLSDEDPQARYPSAQIAGAGDRIYFTRETQGITETRVAFPTPDKNLPFGNVRIVQFTGEHPRLSSDGLRQYLYDGRTVRRARRAAINLPFLGTEKVAEVEIPEFRPSAGHRQFCVSDDEQWMIYSDNPVGAGDLWLVRLHDGPGWGVPLSGATIDPKPLARTTPAMQPPEELFSPPAIVPESELPPDPRSRPLPYVAFREKIVDAVGRREFDAALDAIEAAQVDPQLSAVQELIEWDRQEIQQIATFWQDVQRGAESLKPGDKLRFGTLTVDFEKYADGVISAKARTQTVSKSLPELDAAALVTLAERVLDPAKPEEAFRAAVFLAYSDDGTSSRRQKLLAAAGPLGTEFQARLAQREAALARLELDRENIAAALARIETLERSYPESKAAERAGLLRDGLYDRTAWQRSGNRDWQIGPSGEFTAGPERSDNAMLLSPNSFGDFSLTMEYRTNAPVGQGGVYFTYTGRGRLDTNALKIQLSNDAGVRPDAFCTGALFNVEAPAINAAKPLGEWNTFAMSLRGRRLSATINGQPVLNTQIDPGERTGPGYIALDGESGGISYRKVILSDQPAVR
jgi:hypothetical protein